MRKKDQQNNAAEVPMVVDPEHTEKLERLFASIKHPKKRKWLAAIAVCGRIQESHRLTGINTAFHYLWLKKDPQYPEAYEAARSIAADKLEDEVYRRASGFDHPLSFQGRLTGDVIKQYSDLCAFFWLKGQMPQKYREDSRLQINVNVPPAVSIVAAIDVTDASKALDHDTPDSEKALKV